MRQLSEKLEQDALQTEWNGWMRDVLRAFAEVSIRRPDTWEVLAPLAEPVAAVRWLVGQIRRGNTRPPEQPHEETKFYLLAAFCPDNRVLGYLIDTYLHYYRTRNRLGVLSCVRIVATVNDDEGYSHLNFLYNLMMGTRLREYRHHGPASRALAPGFQTVRIPGTAAGLATSSDGEHDQRRAGLGLLHVRIRLSQAVQAGTWHPGFGVAA